MLGACVKVGVLAVSSPFNHSLEPCPPRFHYGSSSYNIRNNLKCQCQSRDESESSRNSKSKAQNRSSEDLERQRLRPNIGAVFQMSAEEARALGIPDYALPHLSSDPTLEEARAAQQKIESIVASFMSADI